MTPLQLAQTLQDIHQRLSAYRSGVEQRIGDARVVIDPASTSEYPSSNRNRIEWACDGPRDAARLDEIMAMYAARSVGRYFLWASPRAHPDDEALLTGRGFKPVPFVKYPVLVRPCSPPAPAKTDFSVREATPEDASRHGAAIRRIYADIPTPDAFDATIGKPGFDYFLAFDGDTPVAAGLLFTHGSCGYLGSAATHAAYRKRGGQSALIAARLARAAERGCTWCVSETISILRSSLANLMRQGFQPAFVYDVYGWNSCSSPAPSGGGVTRLCGGGE